MLTKDENALLNIWRNMQKVKPDKKLSRVQEIRLEVHKDWTAKKNLC